MTIKVTCAECGKEFELDDKWEGFAKKYPDRLKCFNCKSGKKESDDSKKVSDYKKQTSKKSYTPKSNYKAPQGMIKPEHFADFYLALKEVMEERGIFNEVHDFMGGWTTSLIIQADKEGNLE